MAFVKANFRTKATDVQWGALGRNLQNWIAGSGVNAPFGFQGGGFVFASAASVSASAFCLIGASDALIAAYGVTYVSNILGNASGFKYIPVAVMDVSGGVTYHLSATGAVAGDDSIVVLAVNSASGAYSGAVHYIHFGFIVSVPDAFR